MPDIQTRESIVEQVTHQLEELEDRLIERYSQDAVPTDATIRKYLGDAREPFVGAPIQTYVPILIERSVLARLRRESAG